MDLDAIDINILSILQEDGRISFSELGRQVGLSQPAVSERVKRLEEYEVIVGYTAKLNLKTLGLSMTALVRLNTSHDKIKHCLALFKSIPEIIEVDRVTGEDCFFLRVVVTAPEHLETIVDAIATYGSVTTSLVFRNYADGTIDKVLFEKVAGSKLNNC